MNFDCLFWALIYCLDFDFLYGFWLSMFVFCLSLSEFRFFYLNFHFTIGFLYSKSRFWLFIWILIFSVRNLCFCVWILIFFFWILIIYTLILTVSLWVLISYVWILIFHEDFDFLSWDFDFLEDFDFLPWDFDFIWEFWFSLLRFWFICGFWLSLLGFWFSNKIFILYVQEIKFYIVLRSFKKKCEK